MVSWGGVVLWCPAGLPMDSIGGNGGMAGSRKHAACMVGGLAARGEWEESYYRGATLRTTRGSCQLQAEALHVFNECIYEISKWSFSYSNKTRHFKILKSYHFTMFCEDINIPLVFLDRCPISCCHRPVLFPVFALLWSLGRFPWSLGSSAGSAEVSLV